MAKHDQRPDKSLMTCTNCKDGNCHKCIDVYRAVYSNNPMCQCTRKRHSGEPMDVQIKDPETGTVYAPGLTVDELGRVAVDPEKKAAFLKQFTEAVERVNEEE